MLSAFYVAVATGRVFIADRRKPRAAYNSPIAKKYRLIWQHTLPTFEERDCAPDGYSQPMESLGNIMKVHLTGVQIHACN